MHPSLGRSIQSPARASRQKRSIIPIPANTFRCHRVVLSAVMWVVLSAVMWVVPSAVVWVVLSAVMWVVLLAVMWVVPIAPYRRSLRESPIRLPARPSVPQCCALCPFSTHHMDTDREELAMHANASRWVCVCVCVSWHQAKVLQVSGGKCALRVVFCPA